MLFRVISSLPLAALVTILIFLALTAQLAPRPFVEQPSEDAGNKPVRAGDICMSERGYNRGSCFSSVQE